MSRLTDLLNLSHVPRWCITPVLKSQSVAEHSFRVAVIARELAWRLGWDRPLYSAVVIWAMEHDAPEAFTGDIPSPFKRHLKELELVQHELCPWYDEAQPGARVQNLVHLADSIEALSWIAAYGMAARCRFDGDNIAHAIRTRIHKEATAMGEEWHQAVCEILGEVAP